LFIYGSALLTQCTAEGRTGDDKEALPLRPPLKRTHENARVVPT